MPKASLADFSILHKLRVHRKECYSSHNLWWFAHEVDFYLSYHLCLPESSFTHIKIQFISVCLFTKSCPTLCGPMNSSMPGFSIFKYFPEFLQTDVQVSQWCHPTISSSVTPFSSCPQFFPASGSFPMRQLSASGGQSIEALASVLCKS